jgi:8-oxo-dGTP diphosphatase
VNARSAPIPQAAVSAAIFREGRVLLVKRRRAPAAGLWSLPGGHVEPGEAALDAVTRELLEETSVTAKIAGVAGIKDVIHRSDRDEVLFHRLIVVFFGEWLSGEARAGDDAEETGWFEPDRLSGLAATEGLAEIVGMADRRLRNSG